MTFEQALQNNLFNRNVEKTAIDKVLDRADVEAIRGLIKKKNLKREEMLEILYLLSSNEIKLLNYSEWDRYLMVKFFVWIREFIKMLELLYDYEDELKKKSNVCSECKGYIVDREEVKKSCACVKPIPTVFLSDRTKRTFENIKQLSEHNAKFLIDLYLNIARSTLSLKGSAFDMLLKERFEMAYPQANNLTPTPEDKGGIFKFGKGK